MVSRCGRGICFGPSTQTHTCKMLVLRPDLLVKLPSFSVSSCTIPDPPHNMDSGYFQFYLAGKLLICGGSAQCYRMQTGGWVVDSTLPAARSSSSGVSLRVALFFALADVVLLHGTRAPRCLRC